MTTVLVILLCIFTLMLWIFTLGLSSVATYIACKKKFKRPTEENLTAEEKRKKEIERKYTENLYSYNGEKQN